MSYNQRNKLERICEIQRITLEHTQRGVTQKWVYDHVVRPRFLISIATYYNYLGVPARKELNRMRAVDALQPSLF